MILSVFIDETNKRSAIFRDDEPIFIIFTTFKALNPESLLFNIVPTEKKYFKLLRYKKYRGYLERVLQALHEYEGYLKAASQKHEELTEKLKIEVKN